MECSEARWLLDSGLEPGPRHPTRERLGFHLAGCAACRAHQSALHQDLLAGLLRAQPAAPAHPAAPPRLSGAARATRSSATRHRSLALIAGGCLALLLTLVVLRAASQVLAIRQNVQAYIVPTRPPAPARAAATPAPVATATPAATAPTTVAAQPTRAAEPQPSATAAAPAAPTLIPIVPTSVGAAGLIPTLAPVTVTPQMPTSGDGPVTILLLGSDNRPDEQGYARTDTVIVARIDPALRRVALLSLPRDLVVEIPGYGYGRINAAHVYGDLYPELGGGLALARASVSKLVGVPIDYAVKVDFSGFIGLIDAIGGVDIDVPSALYDAEYPTMDYGYMVVAFDAGPQHMDGARALQYVRIRHMDSDFERARRQQQVLIAAARHLREQNPLALLDTLTALTGSLRGYVWTDLPEDRMLGLAWALRDLTPDSVERYLVDERYVTFNGEGGGCSSADDYWAACSSPATLRPLIQQWLGASPS